MVMTKIAQQLVELLLEAQTEHGMLPDKHCTSHSLESMSCIAAQIQDDTWPPKKRALINYLFALKESDLRCMIALYRFGQGFGSFEKLLFNVHNKCADMCILELCGQHHYSRVANSLSNGLSMIESGKER